MAATVDNVAHTIISDPPMVILNNQTVIDPSSIEWGISDISGANAGRDEKGIMHPMKICSKVQYKLTWNNINASDAHTILSAIDGVETFEAVLYDPVYNARVTGRKFYVGDRSAPMKQWRDGANGKVYTTVSFTIIEV